MKSVFNWKFWNKAAAEPAPEGQTEGEQKEKKKLTPAQSFFKEAKEILVMVAVFMLVYVLCFRAVVVKGESMYDTLCHGDRLLVINNFLYRNPQPGDIIVASKDSFRDGECIIKRVIATEGQEVNIDFATGTVYVDGVAQDEPYLYSPTKRPEGMTFPLVVEEGCLFVMGDNRMDSKDSRDPEIGLIDKREVLGEAVLLLFPGRDKEGSMDFSRIGVIG